MVTPMDVFGGLAQGYKTAQQIQMGPQLNQLKLLQEQAKLNQLQGLDPVSQQDIAASQQRMDIAQQEQGMKSLEFISDIAMSLDGMSPEDRSVLVERMSESGIPINQLTDEEFSLLSKMGRARRANDPKSQRLSLDMQRLIFQRERARTDLEQNELDRELREKELELKNITEQRQAKKLSSASEQNLIKSQDASVQNTETANQFSILIDDYGRLDPQSGLLASFDEFLAGALGSQDEVNELRRRFNKVRLGEALKNLPPGPATDKDVEEAFKGVPKSNASPEQVKSFLRGARRLALFNAGFEQFKSEYISDKGNTRGLLTEWRKPLYSPIAKQDVSMMEIYEAAIDEGLTVEAVKEKLGIK